MTSGVTAPNTRPTSIRTHSRPATSKNIVAHDATPQLVEVKDKPVKTAESVRSPVKSRSVSPNARLTLGSPTKSVASSQALGKILSLKLHFCVFEKRQFLIEY